MRTSRLTLSLLPLACLLTREAPANERNFAFAYQTPVLAPGQAELEPSSTWSYGKKDYFSRFDERLEFEFGIAPGLQSALYMNFRGQALDTVEPVTGSTIRDESLTFKGLSSEWKYQFTDPVADVLGSAAYLEGTLSPTEAELELKLLLDKRLGNFILASNLVGEGEFEWEAPGETEKEYKLEVLFAAGYFLAPTFSVGAEAVQDFVFTEGKLETAPLYLGPTISAAQENWWLSLSVLPQLVSWNGGDGAGIGRDRDHSTDVMSRLVLGFHI